MPTLSDIRETFNLAGGGTNLTPKLIDRLLFEGVRKFAPLRRVFPRKTWESDIYYFNQRTALPKAQATTESPSTTDVVATASTYTQKNFPIKHTQSQLDIAKFTAQVARVNGNIYDLEIMGAALSMAWLEEIFHLYGSSGATLNTKRPQWDGLDLLTASPNKIDGGNAIVTLAMLDAMIDAIKGVAATQLSNGDWCFLVSPKMQSRLNGIFVNQQRWVGAYKMFARDDYGIPGQAVVDSGIDAGVEVMTYRGIPIMETSFLDNVGAMTTVSVSDNGGSGSQLLNQAYYYQVEAVTEYGITTASTEVSVTPTAGHNVLVSWTTPSLTDVYGNAIRVLAYRIHRSNASSSASGTESLYAVVSALDNTDTPITSWVDTGLPVVPSQTSTAYAVTIATSGPAAVPDGVTFPRNAVAGQNISDIFLVSRNPEFSLVPVLNEISTQFLAPVNARTTQLALTADMTYAMRAPTFAAKLCRVRSN